MRNRNSQSYTKVVLLHQSHNISNTTNISAIYISDRTLLALFVLLLLLGTNTSSLTICRKKAENHHVPTTSLQDKILSQHTFYLKPYLLKHPL